TIPAPPAGEPAPAGAAGSVGGRVLLTRAARMGRAAATVSTGSRPHVSAAMPARAAPSPPRPMLAPALRPDTKARLLGAYSWLKTMDLAMVETSIPPWTMSRKGFRAAGAARVRK